MVTEEELPADAAMKTVIDELVKPLIDDHHKFLVPADPDPLVVGSAELHYVKDQYGHQMLDFSGQLAPIGHNHPFVAEAIREHLRYYTRTAPAGQHVLRWPTQYARELVESFATADDLVPDLKVMFTEGEYEATVKAKMVGQHVSKSGSVYEPALIEHGVGALIPKETVQERVREARQRGDAIVFDETRLGFARLGPMWAQKYYEVTPDVTILGGPLGGSLPLGAVIAPSAAFQSRPLVSPLAGSPLACAAGSNTMRALNPALRRHVQETGEEFGKALNELVGQYVRYLARTTGAGLWHSLDFHTNSIARQFSLDARRHGLLVPPPTQTGTTIVLTPPLIASTQEVLRGADLIADVLEEWGDDLPLN